jgi:beta-glucosidase
VVASRAVVLLKNDAEALPLDLGLPRLAVVGPLADGSTDMRGPWWGAAAPAGPVTVLAALRRALADSRVLHAPGVDIDGGDLSGMAAALAVCDQATVIVLCVGEAASMSGEAASRAHLDLPGLQRQFAEAVFERAGRQGKRVIVVLFSGRPLVVPWLAEKADALLAAWFLGSEAGNAVADVLLGHVSPSGRTPVSWARDAGQVPIFFGARPTGRPFDPIDHYTSKYLDVPNDPLYPFGHGLTYGRFVYSNLRVPRDGITENDTIVIRVDVQNDGGRPAEETVFLFTHDTLASVSRPVLELKGFAKIHLNPGARGTVTLMLPARELRFLGLNLDPVFEPGEVEILVGPCADRGQLLTDRIRLVS